jgi:hypothetical protein
MVLTLGSHSGLYMAELARNCQWRAKTGPGNDFAVIAGSPSLNQLRSGNRRGTLN